MSKLCLNMVVKNESRNMERCLRALRPHISCAVIADTGSTDDTKEIIARELRDLPHEIHDVPYESVSAEIDGERYFMFDAGRNAALQLARSSPLEWDYLLFCDADMELVIDGKAFPPLKEHCYALMQDNGLAQYWNVRLLRRDRTEEYKGITHECLTLDPPPFALTGAWYRDHETGANRYNKYLRDVKLLSKGLRDEPDNSRYVFYMAQSLAGLEMWERAREFCELRIKMGAEVGMPEEAWWAQLQIGRINITLEEPFAQVVESYLKAFNMRPQRAEPLLNLSKYLQEQGHLAFATILARTAAMTPKPAEVLPVDTHCYEWSALDQWLCCAMLTNDADDARIAARVLATRSVPESELERIRTNIAIVNKTCGAPPNNEPKGAKHERKRRKRR